jgi:hypothetical protein
MEAAFGGLGGLLLFGTLAALANLVGGLLLIKSGAHRLGERFLKYLVAQSASGPTITRAQMLLIQ